MLKLRENKSISFARVSGVKWSLAVQFLEFEATTASKIPSFVTNESSS